MLSVAEQKKLAGSRRQTRTSPRIISQNSIKSLKRELMFASKLTLYLSLIFFSNMSLSMLRLVSAFALGLVREAFQTTH